MVPRVFLSCEDRAFCKALRGCFRAGSGFVICDESRIGPAAAEKARKLHPDLIILEMAMPRENPFDLAGAFRSKMPNVLLFLITVEPGMQFEKKALANGIDAVFEKTPDCQSLVMNARVACGLD
jgi:DNA-binding NarL/FixJ family response regulator